jgi:hypothetical protein
MNDNVSFRATNHGVYRIKLIENLRNLEGAPGVAFSEIPPDTYLGDEEESDPDVRISRT